MGKAVAIRYEVTVEDLVEFSLFHLRQSKAQQQVQRKGYFLTIIFILIGTYLGGGFGQIFKPFFWYAILPVMGFLTLGFILIGRWLRPRAVRRAVRRLYDEGANPGLVGLHKVTVNDRGIHEESEVGESRVNWEGITRIVSSDSHTYIYIGAAQAHVIPKASIREGDYDAFVAEAQLWFQTRPSQPQEV